MFYKLRFFSNFFWVLKITKLLFNTLILMLWYAFGFELKLLWYVCWYFKWINDVRFKISFELIVGFQIYRLKIFHSLWISLIYFFPYSRECWLAGGLLSGEFPSNYEQRWENCSVCVHKFRLGGDGFWMFFPNVRLWVFCSPYTYTSTHRHANEHRVSDIHMEMPNGSFSLCCFRFDVVCFVFVVVMLKCAWA